MPRSARTVSRRKTAPRFPEGISDPRETARQSRAGIPARESVPRNRPRKASTRASLPGRVRTKIKRSGSRKEVHPRASHTADALRKARRDASPKVRPRKAPAATLREAPQSARRDSGACPNGSHGFHGSAVPRPSMSRPKAKGPSKAFLEPWRTILAEDIEPSRPCLGEKQASSGTQACRARPNETPFERTQRGTIRNPDVIISEETAVTAS